MSGNAIDHQRFDLDLLGRVVEQLSDPNGTLALHVSDGLRERIFLFVPGGVRLLTRGEGSREALVHHLVSKCFVDMELLEELREETKVRKRPLSEVALEKEVLARADLLELNQRIVRDEVFGLVFWECGFCVVSDEAPRAVYSTQRQVFASQFDRRELYVELSAWIRRWPRIREVFPSEATRVLPTELAVEAQREGVGEIGDGVRDCLEWCTHETTLGELWRDSGHHLPDLCDELIELSKNGFVELVAPEVSSADLRKDLDRQIERMEETVEHLINPDLGRERLLECYRNAGQTHKIVHELHVAADSLTERGRVDEAIERWRQICDLEVENLGAHEKLFRALVAVGEEGRAIAHASEFASKCLLSDGVEEARFLAGLIASTSIGSLEARRIEAFALEATGKYEQAAEGLLDLAGELVGLGKSNRALQFAQTALQWDPDSTAAAELVRSLKASGVGGPGGAGSFRSPATVSTGGSFVAARVEDIPLATVGDLAGEASNPSVAVEDTVSRGLADELDARPLSAKLLAMSLVLAAAFGAYFGVRSLSGDVEAVASTSTESEITLIGEDDSERVRRVVGDRQVAEWRPSRAFDLVNRWSGKLVAHLEGREGAMWAVSFRARRVCRWKPGEAATIFIPLENESTTLSWKLPDDTAAVAIGESFLAVRRAQHTFLYSFDGTPSKGGALPPWTEGLFVDGLLVVQGLAERKDDRALEIRAVQPQDMSIIWSARVGDGAFSFPSSTP